MTPSMDDLAQPSRLREAQWQPNELANLGRPMLSPGQQMNGPRSLLLYVWSMHTILWHEGHQIFSVGALRKATNIYSHLRLLWLSRHQKKEWLQSLRYGVGRNMHEAPALE